MRPFRLLLLFACLLFWLSLAALFLMIRHLAPTLEAAVNPVIDVEACDVSTSREMVEGEAATRVDFRTCWRKYRPCPLAGVTWAWFLGEGQQLVVPATIIDTTTGEQFRPQGRRAVTPPATAANPDAGLVRGAPYHTFLPSVAYSFTAAELHGTLEYQCRPGAPLLYDVTIAVEIPAADPFPLPQAEPGEKTGGILDWSRLARR